jgi:hypothetical protein
MNLSRTLPLLGTLSLLGLAVSAQAQVIVYDNLGGTALAGYSEVNTNNPVFGDALDLTSGGRISNFGFTVFNSSSGGNTGSILTADVQVNFRDNTVPYGGGVLSGTLLGSVTISLNFGTGLPAGFFSTVSADLSSLNIVVPSHIFVTQQLTQTSGSSLRNGIVLFSTPSVGSSPNSVYLKSNTTSEGLYTFNGLNNNDLGYHLEIVPEPATLAILGIGAVAFLRRRKR